MREQIIQKDRAYKETSLSKRTFLAEFTLATLMGMETIMMGTCWLSDETFATDRASFTAPTSKSGPITSTTESGDTMCARVTATATTTMTSFMLDSGKLTSATAMENFSVASKTDTRANGKTTCVTEKELSLRTVEPASQANGPKTKSTGLAKWLAQTSWCSLRYGSMGCWSLAN